LKQIDRKNSTKARLLVLDKWSSVVCLWLLLIVCTGYIFLNARNDDRLGDFFLLILLSVSLPRLFIRSDDDVTINRKIVFCFWGYLIFALASVLFPPTDLVNPGWFVKSFFRLVLIFFIIQAVWVKIDFDCEVIRWLLPLLCFILGLIAILTAYGLLDKHTLSVLTPWPVVETGWNKKVFSFYILFLMWAAVACLWRRSRLETVIAFFIFGVTSWVLLLYNSESAQLSCFCGLLVFGLVHIPFKRYRYWVYLTIFMMFLLVPFLWVAFAPILPSDAPKAIYNDSLSFLRQNWNIGSRVFIYDFCADMAGKEVVLGHGFGSALTLPYLEGIISGWERIPGGHPHNIVFLMLLDHGVLGFLWLAGMLYILFDYLYHATLNRKEGPVVWALVISGQIVFSLSFSIWNADVVLTYGFFFIFLMIVSRLSDYKGTTDRRENVFRVTQGLVFLIFVCHVVDYHILSVI